MKVLGIICEFNPFHNGHRYLIEKTKKETNSDAVVAVMSGNFTQRGFPAITDKRTRAESAIQNGVDLVLELPSAFAVQSAQYFARKGIETLNACNIVDTLAFGSESGDLEVLSHALTYSESAEYSSDVREGKNCSLASALAKASYDSAVYTPNNILGIEYLRALKETESAMKPYTCERVGVDHDSDMVSDEYASASYIRNALYREVDTSSFLPSVPQNIINKETWGNLVLYRLRTMSIDELERVCGVSEGLHNRIFNSAKTAKSYDALVESIKTKRYTRTRIERVLTCAVLGIRQEHLLQSPYLRVLAATDVGIALIREIQKHTPVIVKTADASHPLLELECRADDIYALLFNDKTGLKTFQTPIIKQPR